MASSPSSVPNTVMFQSPTTGASQALPPEQWDDAIKAGYKPTDHVIMYSPQGQRGLVPNAQSADYARQGYQTSLPTQYERSQQNQPGIMGSAWDELKTQGQGLVNRMKGEVEHPIDTMAEDTVGPAIDMYANWQNRKAAGYNLPYRMATAGMEAAGVPTGATGMEDAAARGNWRGVVGHAAVPIVEAAAPLAAEGVARTVGAAGRGLRSVARDPATNALTPRANDVARIGGAGVGMVAAPVIRHFGGTGAEEGLGGLGGMYLGERLGPRAADLIIPKYSDADLLQGRIARGIKNQGVRNAVKSATTPPPTPPPDTVVGQGTPTSGELPRPAITYSTDSNGTRWASAPDGVKVSLKGPMSTSEVQGALDSQRQAQAAIRARMSGNPSTTSTGQPVQMNLAGRMAKPEETGFKPYQGPSDVAKRNMGRPASGPSGIGESGTRSPAPLRGTTPGSSILSEQGPNYQGPFKPNTSRGGYSASGGPEPSGGGGTLSSRITKQGNKVTNITNEAESANQIGANERERAIGSIISKNVLTPEDVQRLNNYGVRPPRQGESLVKYRNSIVGDLKADRARTEGGR